MRNNLQLFKAMQKNKLQLNDTFAFNCLQCGNCCKNRHDILLTAYDFFRAAKHLNLPPQQFFEKYCEAYVGDVSKTLVIRLKPKTVYNVMLKKPVPLGTVCPLLTSDGLCSIQNSKPVLCAAFPLGRFSKEGDKASTYFLQDLNCGDKSKSQTLKEWLEKFNLLDADDVALVWSEFLTYAVKLLQKADKLQEKTKELIHTAYLNMIYLRYDISKEFLPQLVENIKAFKELMIPLGELLKSQSEETP